MSRGIPPVRRWRVRIWKDATLLDTRDVNTINKRFAQWEALDRVGWFVRAHFDRITVSLTPATKEKQA